MKDHALTMQQIAVKRALRTGEYEHYRQELVKLNAIKAQIVWKIVEELLTHEIRRTTSPPLSFDGMELMPSRYRLAA